MGKAIELFQPRFQKVINLASQLANSEVFSTFLAAKGMAGTRVPTYCQVRWYSIWRVFKRLKKLKAQIIGCHLLERLAPVPGDVWRTIEEFQGFIKVVKKATNGLEGEEMSIICYVLSGLAAIREAFVKLARNADYAEIYR